MEIKVVILPATLVSALRSLGYHKATIAVEACESVSVQEIPCYTGNRAVVCLVNIATGQRSTVEGSWGGPTMFAESAANPVDSAEREHALPVNGAMIKGESGGRGVFLRIYVRPDSMAALLPATAADAPTDREKTLLSVFQGLKSFARADAMKRNGLTDADIDAAIAKGWLTKNKAGAVALTPNGKVTAQNNRVRFNF